MGSDVELSRVSAVLLLSAEWRRTRSEELRKALQERLDAIARSRQRDHLAGGFHAELPGPPARYEKLLWRNALLLRAFAEGHEATGELFFRQVAEETARWTIREMRDSRGFFWSALSGTSEGVAGKYYVWKEQEVSRALGPDRTAELTKTYSLRPDGLLTLEGSPFAGLGDSGAVLLSRRARRIRPPIDDVAITGWNGLMIGALARSGQLLGRGSDIEAARRAAEALLRTVGPPRELKRCARGADGRGSGLLEDYAYLAQGLLDLHEATREARWLELVEDLVEHAIRRFWDRKQGFFDSDAAHGPFLDRLVTYRGAGLPSANGVMLNVLARLARIPGQERHGALARDLAGLVAQEIVADSSGTETAAIGLSTFLAAGGR